jgi:hypothetical protein
MGANPIAYGEIESYCRLMKVELTIFEVTALKRLDLAALETMNKEND